MHEKYSHLLQQYVDREISPLEKMLVEEHLLFCRACRQELNQLKLLDWDLKHEPAVEVPAELTASRMAAIKTHLTQAPVQQRSSGVRDLWRLQLQIMFHTSSFIGINPVNRTVNRTVKRSVSLLGKVASAAVKKKNPLLSRIIPGGT